MLLYLDMRLLGKVLVIAGAASAGIAGLAAGLRTILAGKTAQTASARPAGAMFVGAVDEVELSGPLRPDQEPGYDREEVASEHPEINELRAAMPFG